MEIHNHNLNISYSLVQKQLDKLQLLYEQMPGWIRFIDGIPYWYGTERDGKFITASVEPSGLQFYSELPNEEWENWFELFKKRAVKIFGFEVEELEY